MSEKNGGPAFPGIERFEEYDTRAEKLREFFAPVGGMTLRDHFAGQALIGLLSNPGRTYGRNPLSGNEAHLLLIDDYVDGAYRYADAMVRRREKGGE